MKHWNLLRVATQCSTSCRFSHSGAKVWRQYDDGFIVRSMTQVDATTVTDWYHNNMGVISRHDLRIALSCFPPDTPGFYMGEYKGQPVASAVRVPWGDNVLYGSLYYVVEQYRRHKFGSRLRAVASEFVGSKILCIDAVIGNVTTDSAKRLRAVQRHEVYRFSGVAGGPEINKDAGGSVRIVRANEVDFEKLVGYDNECFVSQNFPARREFLSKWITIKDGVTYVAIDKAGNIQGYGSRRPAISEHTHVLGPLYANSSLVAEAVLTSLMSGILGDHVCIAASSQNKASLDLFTLFGLKEEFALNRMHINGDAKENKDTVYGLTSIDVCAF